MKNKISNILKLLALLILMSAQYSCMNPDAIREKSKDLIKQKKFELALLEINKAIKKEPDSSQNYLIRALINLNLNRHQKELDDYNKAIELSKVYNEETERIYFWRASLEKQIGMYKEALSDINYIIDNNSGSIDVFDLYFEKAQLLYNMKNFTDAKNIYNKILAENIKNNNTIKAKALVGLSLLTDSKQTQYNYLNEAILADETSAIAYAARGSYFLENKQLKQSYSDFIKAISIDSNLSEINFNLGQLFFNYLTNYDSALYYFNKEIEVNPMFLDKGLLFNNMAICYQYKKEFEESSKYFLEAEKINSNNDFILYNFSLLLSEMGDHKDALEKIDKAIIINPTESSYYDTKGIILCEQGNFNESLIFFKKAIELDPGNGQIFYNLGLALGELNLPEESILYYDKAVSLKYDLQYTLVNRALQKIKIKDIQSACDDLSKAFKLGRTDIKPLMQKYCN